MRVGAAAQVGVAALLCLTLANCGKNSGVDPKYGVSASPRVIAMGEPVPKGGGRYSVGKPYQIAGRTYVPEEDPNYSATGIASWYGDDFHGRKTANGEIFDMQSIAAAHPTLPLPSYVRVTNLRNKKSLIVRVNDRGPYHEGRVIDLSARAAKLLDFHRYGVARVKVEYVGRASIQGSDDLKLEATLRHDDRTPAPAPKPSSSEVRVASSKPFMPEYFDPKPMVARGDIPTPPERPFELGQGEEPPSRLANRRAPAPAMAAVSRPSVLPATAPQAPRLASAESRPVALATGGQPQPRMVWSEGAAPANFDSRFGTPSAPAPANGPVSAFAPRGLY